MPTGQTDGRTPVTLRFPLDAACETRGPVVADEPRDALCYAHSVVNTLRAQRDKLPTFDAL